MPRLFKTILARSLLIALGIIVPCFIFEMGLRVEHLIRKGIPLSINPNSRWDKTLGWLGREHILDGSPDHPILVLGDSFTEGLEVPGDQMWFASLKSVFPERKLIAYGGLGYGTLQELMVLRDYLARGISPGLIVVQLCSNDIINNYYLLEKESYLQRAPGPRPYLDGDAIEIKFPRKYDWLLFPLISVSRFAYKYNNKWDGKLAEWARERKIDSVEFHIQEEGFKFPLFRQALGVTDRLLQQLKAAAGKTGLILMLVDNLEPYTAALKGMARKYQMPMVLPLHDHPMPDSGRLPDGTHLNEEGNRILGEAFVQTAKTRGLFPTL